MIFINLFKHGVHIEVRIRMKHQDIVTYNPMYPLKAYCVYKRNGFRLRNSPYYGGFCRKPKILAGLVRISPKTWYA